MMTDKMHKGGEKMETKTTCYLCDCDIPDLEGMEYYTVDGKDICCDCYGKAMENKKIREALKEAKNG